MKNLKPIIIILVVIGIITAGIILLMNRLKPQGVPTLSDPLGIGGSGKIPTTSTGNPIEGLTSVQRVKLERYCSEPAKRKHIEEVYGIKCADYGL